MSFWAGNVHFRLLLRAHAGYLRRKLETRREVIVIKVASNSKAHRPPLLYNTCHPAYALNAHVLAARDRRENKDLNPDFASHRRTLAAVDERAVERDIVGESASRSFAVFVPVKDDWELQLISHRRTAISMERQDFGIHTRLLHSEAKITAFDLGLQAAKCLKIIREERLCFGDLPSRARGQIFSDCVRF